MADGIPAPHRPRPAVGGLRRGDAAAGSVSSHGRIRPRRARRVGPATPDVGQGTDRTRTSPASTRSSRRITAARCRRSSRCSASSRSRGTGDDVHRLGEDDGVGPLRATTRSSCCAHDLDSPRRRRPHGAADAAVPGGRPEHPERRATCPGSRQAHVRERRTSREPRAGRAANAVTTAAPWLGVVLRRDLAAACPRWRDLLLGGATTEALGSNNWVVDGTMTASGKPLLANDPHLGAHVPSTWYLAHMSAPRLRRHRRHAARHAGRRARTQPLHRVGRDQRRRRRRGSLSRASRRDRDDRPSSGARRSRCRSSPRRSS